MIAVVVDGRWREDNIRARLPQQLGNTPPRRIIIEDGQIAELGADVFGADHGSGPGGFASPDVCNLVRRIVPGAAVAGRHGDDRHMMPPVDQVGQGARRKYLNVVGVCVNRKDSVGAH